MTGWMSPLPPAPRVSTCAPTPCPSPRRAERLTGRNPLPNISRGVAREMAHDRSSDFGGKLRAARERRGVSLRQLANATKISVGALEALERNDLSRLPGGIFSRAFVRSYAAEVGLDPDEAIQDFLAQFPHDGGTAPAHAQPEPIEEEHA